MLTPIYYYATYGLFVRYHITTNKHVFYLYLLLLQSLQAYA